MTISKERFKELLELQESGDDTIDFSDIPELGDDFWKNATYIRGADFERADVPLRSTIYLCIQNPLHCISVTSVETDA